MLPYDEAKEIVEEVERIAEKKERMPILDLVKTSLTCAEFGIVRYNHPTELITNVCGAEGSGKSTFIASFTAKGFFNKLLRKEHQPDMKAKDLASPTKGIEETMCKHSQVNVRFRDFAGHDHYSASHDLFAVAMTAPSVATIVVDGTESVEEITKRVSATAASYACRQSTSDDGSELDGQQQQPLPMQLQSQLHTQQAGGHQRKLDVVAIATRADLLTPFQRNQVERAVVEGMKSCSQRLELAFVRVVDARNSSSSSMNELRRAFLHLVHKVLAVRAMDTVAATESSLSETCQAAVPGSIAEAAAATATPTVSVADTVSSTVGATADTVTHEAAATTTLADNLAHTVAATAEVTAVATGTVADTMMQTARAMDTVTARESSTSETCQVAVTGSTAEAAAATATPTVSVADTVSSKVAAMAEVPAAATGTVADTMPQTATAMGTVAATASSTSETCQAAVAGSTAEAAAATATPTVSVADTVSSTVAATAEVTTAATATVADTMMQTATAMDTVAARESSTSETCQVAVTRSTAEAAAPTATPTVSVADTVSSTVATTAEVTAAATGTVADTMMQMETAMDTVAARELSTSKTSQTAVTGSTGPAEAVVDLAGHTTAFHALSAVWRGRLTTSAANTRWWSKSWSGDALANRIGSAAPVTLLLLTNAETAAADTAGHADYEADAVAPAAATTAAVADTTAAAMGTAAARESSTSETCQAAVTGIIDNPFDTGTFTSRILPKLCEIPCAMFRRSVQKQGLLHSMAEINELMRTEKYEPVENHNFKIIGYIHPGGVDSYKKLCAAIKGLKYEVLYREMIILLPAVRQPRDD
ncbi:mucin-5B-like [Sycon ciliatum]|uniref:mucin-5B-like n=1 Tax=Sycon ciliatum TaxID=27933 RepID=UPI0031F68A45